MAHATSSPPPPQLLMLPEIPNPQKVSCSSIKIYLNLSGRRKEGNRIKTHQDLRAMFIDSMVIDAIKLKGATGLALVASWSRHELRLINMSALEDTKFCNELMA